MIRIKDIQDKLSSVVGWEQSYNPLNAIDRELTRTESGLYFQGAHPLLTLDNVEAIMPDDFEMRYPLWNTILEYKVRDKVTHNGKVFIAKEDNHSIEPAVSDFNEDFYDGDFGGAWAGYNIVSDYLEQETLKAIAATIQRFLREQTLERGTRDILLQERFYDNPSNTNKMALTGSTCGFYINNQRSLGVTTKLDSVSLQFSEPGKVKLYVAKSLSEAPVRTIELTYTNSQGRSQWFNLDDLYLSGANEWVVYYEQAELEGNMRGIIGTLVGLEATAHICGNRKFLDVRPINSEHKGAGLNFEVTVACDLSDFIIDQRMMFANVIQKQVATTLLRTMALNPSVKINSNQSNVSRMDILYELDGNTNGYRPGGLGHDLKTSYDALKLDLTGLDKYCLTCKRKGVKYGVA
jgi:hypothetical protein